MTAVACTRAISKFSFMNLREKLHPLTRQPMGNASECMFAVQMAKQYFASKNQYYPPDSIDDIMSDIISVSDPRKHHATAKTYTAAMWKTYIQCAARKDIICEVELTKHDATSVLLKCPGYWGHIKEATVKELDLQEGDIFTIEKSTDVPGRVIIANVSVQKKMRDKLERAIYALCCDMYTEAEEERLEKFCVFLDQLSEVGLGVSFKMALNSFLDMGIGSQNPDVIRVVSKVLQHFVDCMHIDPFDFETEIKLSLFFEVLASMNSVQLHTIQSTFGFFESGCMALAENAHNGNYNIIDLLESILVRGIFCFAHLFCSFVLVLLFSMVCMFWCRPYLDFIECGHSCW